MAQDSIAGLFGAESHRHFTGRSVARGWDYVEEEHEHIVTLAAQPGTGRAQRRTFGRLLHTVQDSYAHSNYVELWLRQHGKMASGGPDDIEPFDPRVLYHPHLRTGEWVFWREIFCYLPMVGDVIRRSWVPADSHEALNLDSPARGPSFRIAFEMARPRTQREYRRTVQRITAAGGAEARARFHGIPQVFPHPAASTPGITQAKV